MRLKKDVNIVDFLKKVQRCQKDVYLETEEEDTLNLKSVLSQYLFVVLAEHQDIWKNTKISCCEKDREFLSEYLEDI